MEDLKHDRKDVSETVCHICREILYYPLSDDSIRLDCGHWFHNVCLEPWWGIKLVSECPYCRYSPDTFWSEIRQETDKFLVRYGMKHCETRLEGETWINDAIGWLKTEQKLWVEYRNLRNLCLSGDHVLLDRLLNESITSLVFRGFLSIHLLPQ